MNRILRLCIASCLIVTAACGGNNEENNATNISTNGATNAMTNGMTNGVTNGMTNGMTNNNITTTQCDATGDTCDPAEATNAGFVCIDNTCAQECDPNAETSDCRAGSLCGARSDAGPFFCIASDCNGYLDTTSCPAGQGCVAYINETDLCTDVGMLGDGDACTSTETDPFPCGAGLFCAFGECAAICGDDGACDGAAGERCIDDTLDNGVGFCSVGCDSYSFGQCPTGQGCVPITEEDGVCDDVGTVGPWSACDDMNECGEGTACITFQGADPLTGATEQARCLPFCNPLPETAAERDATCPQPGAAQGYGRFTHLAEGAGMVDIYVDGALAVDDLAFEGVSDAGAFQTLTLGMHTVDITAFDAADNSAPILTLTPTVTGATAVTWAIIPDAATTIDVLAINVPRGVTPPAAGNAKLRPVHAIPDFGAVDVVAIPATETTFANEVELALNVATGAAAAGFAEVPAGNYDIYIFPAGTTPRDTANATGVTINGVTVPADVTVSVYARGTADAGDGADPGLTNVLYASAPAQTGGLGGFCLNLGEEASAQSGFCIEECPNSDVYGTGACTTTGDVCTPLNGGDGCFPGGTAAPGEMCNPDVLEDGCDGVSFCQARGDGTGVCSGYCQPDTQSNPLLGCDATQVCADAGDNLGRCNTDCTPDANFADVTCPDNLETCFTEDDGTAYCGPSGDTTKGAACAVLTGECLAGDTCINQFGVNLGGDDPFTDGVCRDACAPFGDGSECGATEVCGVDFLTLRTGVGFCSVPDENLQPADACQAGSGICGPASACLDIGRGIECVRWCNLDDAATCPSGTACEALFNTDEIRIGACL